ncbi:MAG: polysaccharide deacetylase family protein [Culicoidibacterales bacterium]
MSHKHLKKEPFVLMAIVLSTLLVATSYFCINVIVEQKKVMILTEDINTLQKKYDELVVQGDTLEQQFKDKLAQQQVLAQKTAFLTFDDGPGENTEAILAILARYDVQATFFVPGYMVESYPEQMKAIVSAGHQIGSHSYSHNYREIYASLDNFKADFLKSNDVIKQYTGKDVTLFRHPGGSSNQAGNAEVVSATRQWLTEIGVNYIDWNVDSMDASGQHVAANLIKKATLEQSEYQQAPVILLHDTVAKDTTVEALPQIIEGLQQQGFVLTALPDGADFVQHRKPS